MKGITVRPAEIRKAIVYACVLVGQLLALGLLPSPWDKYATAALGVAALAGIYKVPNDPPKPVVKVPPSHPPLWRPHL